MTGGIRLRVLVLALVPAAAISIVLGVYFVSGQVTGLQQQLEDQGTAIARHLAPASEFGVFSGNRGLLRRLATATQKELNVRSVRISTVDGRLLAASGPIFLPSSAQKSGKPPVSIVPSEDGSAILFRSPILQTEMEISDFPEIETSIDSRSNHSPATIGWVAVELSKKATLDQQMTAIVQSSLIAFVGLLASLVVAIRMGRSVTAPIVKLTQTVEELAKGELSTRADTNANAELLSLEKGINSMAAALQRAQDNLQDEVAHATSELRATLMELESRNNELDIERSRAQNANLSKSQFLANMSHELRTPLNAIIGYSEMLEEEAEQAGHTGYISDVQKVNSAGRHLLSLINDILDLSKVEAGKMTLYLETADIESVIKYTASTIRPLLTQNNNELVLECETDIGSMRMDVTKVRQVLFNLLSNACKFTEEGKVTLGAKRIEITGKEWIEYTVSDTGIGMTPEHMEHLFEAFSQADASITKKYGGTGLGLTLCKSFSELMGGEINVHSESGTGSTFTLLLPIEPPTPVTANEVEESKAPDDTSDSDAEKIRFASASPKEGGRRKRVSNVLIIDDDTLVHDMLRRMFVKEGFEVFTATNGEEGLNRAREIKPDAIILDVLMPGMDGWSVLASLKNDSELSGIPVVMLSMVDDRTRGYALGVTEYLTKPADKQQLLKILRRSVREGPIAPILVVDDDQDQRELLRRSLEGEGWEVIAAHDGRSAFEAVKARPPACIILDILMPGMDGLEFVSELRKQPAFRDIPIAVLTSHDISEKDHRRLNGQVQKILQKGLSHQDLLAMVREIVTRGAGLPKL